MQKWQQWESASEVDWGLAVEREAVIRPLAEQRRLCVEDVEAAVRHLGIGRSVLYSCSGALPPPFSVEPENGGQIAGFRG